MPSSRLSSATAAGAGYEPAGALRERGLPARDAWAAGPEGRRRAGRDRPHLRRRPWLPPAARREKPRAATAAPQPPHYPTSAPSQPGRRCPEPDPPACPEAAADSAAQNGGCGLRVSLSSRVSPSEGGRARRAGPGAYRHGAGRLLHPGPLSCGLVAPSEPVLLERARGTASRKAMRKMASARPRAQV